MEGKLSRRIGKRGAEPSQHLTQCLCCADHSAMEPEALQLYSSFTPALLVNSVVPGVFLGTETILPALNSTATWTWVSCCSPSSSWVRLGLTVWKGRCHSQMTIYNRTQVTKCLNVPEARVPVKERTECRAVEISMVTPCTPDLLPSVK